MELMPIRTEEEYEAALIAVAPYFDADPASGQYDGENDHGKAKDQQSLPRAEMRCHVRGNNAG
jgi:antitoxin component HigA of HigAB toxin-antitoxin module